MAIDGSFDGRPFDRGPRFEMWPGHSKLSVAFQDTEIKATDGGFKDVRLLIQDVRCEHAPVQENAYFAKVLQPMELSHRFSASHLSYRYSKIASAGTVLEKNEPFNFGTLIKTSLLKFPKLEDVDTLQSSLYLLAEDLTLHVAAVPDPYPNVLPPRTDVQLEILSIGPLFGPYLLKGESTSGDGTPYNAKAEYTEKQLLLNVSAQLTLSRKSYSNFSMLFLEGLYDPRAGQMYLIGCRDARASWAILFESMDLENGLDCLVEVVVSYPPTTVRWLVNPTAKISIASQRTEDDPLHFSTVKLQTLPILYRRQREDILSRRGVEGILRILTLTLALICILTQLFYIRGDAESVPFISLVMLGVQAIGYGIPLVTDAEALFKKMSSESYQTQSYDLQRNHWLQLMDYSVKLLVLLCFLVTLRLLQKVWKSRIRLLTRAPLEPHRVPNDKQQKWNYEELRQTLALGRHKLLPVGSKVYERLPSLPEAELVSGVNEDVSHHKDLFVQAEGAESIVKV
ncbi:Protein of unknown function DUF2921 [Dillenia turbinata]|uniref:RING-type E3 ubiquitin transferase n=1 Tax=Dillenia turbinata TaxID=194707 RepID=A0AAN8UB73_9MAGN